MIKVYFHDEADDSLFKYAVIIAKSNENGYFADTGTEPHTKIRADTENPTRISIKQQGVSCGKRPVPKNIR